ncbi:hypothetical protein K492DRAFT_137782 [Lichtheimia hyalospora FSU 10163]|nr:hypothetical protein K492DRAFT_137782 [Lichtheimia hyalospora FSU 10163]
MLHHCIASKFPSWLSISSISPNTILCNVCKRFLLRYECHQDKNDLDDFALATQGARILVDLTAPTFEGNNKGILSLFKRQQQFPSALTAILPWEEPGECWPMAGNHGSLGVELRKPVSVKAVSIGYLDHPAVSNTSAPADFDVWGLTQYEDHQSWKYPWDTFPSMTDRSILYLGRFTYDTTKGHAVQTFEINVGSIPPINAVVFRFLSNWGQNDYTCIYRVRVHGETVA